MKILLTFLSLLFASSVFASSYDCRSDQWYSHSDDYCYDVYGKCSQYNHTDSKTCNSPKDKIRCDWNHRDRSCYPEKRHGGHDRKHRCQPGEWMSENGRCWNKRSSCSQYNYTNSKICNSRKDRMSCDWDHSSRTCYSARSH